MLIYQIYFTIYLDPWTADIFALLPFPTYYKIKLLIIIAINSVCSYIYEKVIIMQLSKYWQARSQRQSVKKREKVVQSFIASNPR